MLAELNWNDPTCFCLQRCYLLRGWSLIFGLLILHSLSSGLRGFTDLVQSNRSFFWKAVLLTSNHRLMICAFYKQCYISFQIRLHLLRAEVRTEYLNWPANRKLQCINDHGSKLESCTSYRLIKSWLIHKKMQSWET